MHVKVLHAFVRKIIPKPITGLVLHSKTIVFLPSIKKKTIAVFVLPL